MGSNTATRQLTHFHSEFLIETPLTCGRTDNSQISALKHVIILFAHSHFVVSIPIITLFVLQMLVLMSFRKRQQDDVWFDVILNG